MRGTKFGNTLRWLSAERKRVQLMVAQSCKDIKLPLEATLVVMDKSKHDPFLMERHDNKMRNLR